MDVQTLQDNHTLFNDSNAHRRQSEMKDFLEGVYSKANTGVLIEEEK